MITISNHFDEYCKRMYPNQLLSEEQLQMIHQAYYAGAWLTLNQIAQLTCQEDENKTTRQIRAINQEVRTEIKIMENTITHPELVRNLKKSGESIYNEIDHDKCAILHMASCIGPEVGELFDAIKKWVFYGKELDEDNVVEELGDIEFYLEGLRQSLDISRERCIAANIAKLSKRYHSGKYSNQHAQERKDKDEKENTTTN